MLAAAATSKVPMVSCARDFIFESGTKEDTRQFYLNHQAQIKAAYRDSNRGPPASECLRTVRVVQPSFGAQL